MHNDGDIYFTQPALCFLFAANVTLGDANSWVMLARTIGLCHIERWRQARDMYGKSGQVRVSFCQANHAPLSVPKLGRSLCLTACCWSTTSSSFNAPWTCRRAALQKARSGRWNQQTKNSRRTQPQRKKHGFRPPGWVIPSYLVGLEEELPVAPVLLIVIIFLIYWFI